MAGDWIKMRAELTTHPRFLALCRELTSGDCAEGFLSYVLGEEVLEKGVYPPRNETVTVRALRCVTERALRDVTLSLLLRVWCAVNTHGKVEGNDAVMPQMGPDEIDAITGCRDFGSAMMAVGWIQQRSPNSLVFPNFLEYNQPASLRGVPLTNAERQARHRSRIKDKESPVTKVTKSNAREEKIREEEPPFLSSPTGEQKNEALPIDPSKPRLAAIWAQFLAHCEALKRKPTRESRSLWIERLKAISEDLAVKTVESWIAGGRYTPPAEWLAAGKPSTGPPPRPVGATRAPWQEDGHWLCQDAVARLWWDGKKWVPVRDPAPSKPIANFLGAAIGPKVKSVFEE